MTSKTDDCSHRFSGEHELFARHEHVRHVAAAATCVLRIPEPEQTRCRELAVKRARKFFGLFPSVRVRRDVTLRKFARLRAKRRVLLGFKKIRRHEADSTTETATGAETETVTDGSRYLRGMHVLRSQRVLVRGQLAPRAIWIEGERIARVTDYDDTDGASIEDFGDDVVMAGLVDTHVHVNEPGRTAWEGFFTATRAAAAGGVTTIVDMPLNSIPATTSVRALEEKAAALEGKCATDVGLWGGAVPGNASELGAILDAGALGFKCFLVDSGVPEFGWLRESDLSLAMNALATRNAPLLVHAELPGPIERAKQSAAANDARAYLTYLRSRPPAAETEAIELLFRECTRTKTRTHVVHLSAADALETIARAKNDSLPFTVETTPHYLKLEAEAIPDGATAFKCAPPIREHENRERLWKGLRDGAIDLVVSDHSPCTPELKKMDVGDFDAAWGGIASLQFGLPIVWTEANARGASIADVARWMSEAPAKLAGLARKGAIEEGRDADFVVWRPEADFTVTNECILHRNKVTPYEGQTLLGVVAATYLRGERVDPRSDRGRGRWLRRGAS